MVKIPAAGSKDEAEVIDEAINALFGKVQEACNIPSGDGAAVFFGDFMESTLRHIVAQYIDFERRLNVPQDGRV